jgi:hypothetical protein
VRGRPSDRSTFATAGPGRSWPGIPAATPSRTGCVLLRAGVGSFRLGSRLRTSGELWKGGAHEACALICRRAHERGGKRRQVGGGPRGVSIQAACGMVCRLRRGGGQLAASRRVQAWAHFSDYHALGLFRDLKKHAHEAAGAWVPVL